MKKYGDTTLDFIPHGLKKNACICGERWSRQMPLELAAGYCGLAGAQALLRIPELRDMIYQCNGKEYLDRMDLDAWIVGLKEKYRKNKHSKSGDEKSAAQNPGTEKENWRV